MPLGYGVFLLPLTRIRSKIHACTHMRTRARNAHARARAHTRVIYILVVGVVVEHVEKLKVGKINRYHVKNKKNS